MKLVQFVLVAAGSTIVASSGGFHYRLSSSWGVGSDTRSSGGGRRWTAARSPPPPPPSQRPCRRHGTLRRAATAATTRKQPLLLQELPLPSLTYSASLQEQAEKDCEERTEGGATYTGSAAGRSVVPAQAMCYAFSTRRYMTRNTRDLWAVDSTSSTSSWI